MAKVTKQYTNRESQSLDKYLQEIGRVELLDPEEEIELARRIKKGDQKALEKLTKANLRFVVSVAKQYQNQGLSLGDLINEGNLGLIKAAKRFDETRGFKFISIERNTVRLCPATAIAAFARAISLPCFVSCASSIPPLPARESRTAAASPSTCAARRCPTTPMRP